MAALLVPVIKIKHQSQILIWLILEKLLCKFFFTSFYLFISDPFYQCLFLFSHMLGQAKMLVSRIQNTISSYNFENKWKLINFFIGGNDLCEACEKDRQTAKNFLQNIRETLDYFEANLKRTVVNLVLTLDVTGNNNFF